MTVARCGGAPCWIPIDWAILICIELAGAGAGCPAGVCPLDTVPVPDPLTGLSTLTLATLETQVTVVSPGGGALPTLVLSAHRVYRAVLWYCRCTSSDEDVSNLRLQSAQELSADLILLNLSVSMFLLMSLVTGLWSGCSCWLPTVSIILSHCPVSPSPYSLDTVWAGSEFLCLGQWLLLSPIVECLVCRTGQCWLTAECWPVCGGHSGH